MKNQTRAFRLSETWNGTGLPPEPPRRSVKGKAAKHFLEIATRCDSAAENYESLCRLERELRDDPNRAWMHRPEELQKWEAKVEDAKRLASTYRARAGKQSSKNVDD